MTQALQRLVETAELQPTRDGDADKLARLDAREKELVAIRDRLLPVEKAALEEVTGLLSKVASVRKPLERRVAGLRRVSLLPLTWRRPDGFPTLAVFSLDYEYVAIRNLYRGDDRSHPYTSVDFCRDPRDRWRHGDARKAAPSGIELCYADLVRHSAMTPAYWTADPDNTVSARFAGVIPDNVKQKIARWKPSFDDVFLVAEPPSWVVHVHEPDPLVVGWDGASLWLIDAFDVTSVEDAMIAEILR